ncbi:hypothetical protein BaOVIS_013700 [Babesia ovis]|uniref:Uncharacterized protein n=1 Tax=Babesia ovis TaxID=5869 RepID=A0A9W5WUJ1_BABOV|nr:hypothetical protein BaOVIS_013700 [Babesia ovis]
MKGSLFIQLLGIIGLSSKIWLCLAEAREDCLPTPTSLHPVTLPNEDTLEARETPSDQDVQEHRMHHMVPNNTTKKDSKKDRKIRPKVKKNGEHYYRRVYKKGYKQRVKEPSTEGKGDDKNKIFRVKKTVEILIDAPKPKKTDIVSGEPPKVTGNDAKKGVDRSEDKETGSGSTASDEPSNGRNTTSLSLNEDSKSNDRIPDFRQQANDHNIPAKIENTDVDADTQEDAYITSDEDHSVYYSIPPTNTADTWEINDHSKYNNPHDDGSHVTDTGHATVAHEPYHHAMHGHKHEYQETSPSTVDYDLPEDSYYRDAHEYGVHGHQDVVDERKNLHKLDALAAEQNYQRSENNHEGNNEELSIDTNPTYFETPHAGPHVVHSHDNSQKNSIITDNYREFDDDSEGVSSSYSTKYVKDITDDSDDRVMEDDGEIGVEPQFIETEMSIEEEDDDDNVEELTSKPEIKVSDQKEEVMDEENELDRTISGPTETLDDESDEISEGASLRGLRSKGKKGKKAPKAKNDKKSKKAAKKSSKKSKKASKDKKKSKAGSDKKKAKEAKKKAKAEKKKAQKEAKELQKEEKNAPTNTDYTVVSNNDISKTPEIFDDTNNQSTIMTSTTGDTINNTYGTTEAANTEDKDTSSEKMATVDTTLNGGSNDSLPITDVVVTEAAEKKDAVKNEPLIPIEESTAASDAPETKEDEASEEDEIEEEEIEEDEEYDEDDADNDNGSETTHM